MGWSIAHRDLALMTPAKTPFTRAGWVFEIKYDGFRTLALHQAADVRIISRRGTDMTGCYPEVAAARGRVRTFQHAERLGLEGIVAKRADAPYRQGRSSNWVKIKTAAGRAIDEERAKWMEPR